MDEYRKLKELVDSVEEDILKAEGGNKAAGTRVRKVMQEIKNTAQSVREKILTLRSDEGQSEPDASTESTSQPQQ